MGKLLIAVGEWMFGLNSFGWRFASAVFGSLAILLMCRIARRMTRSTLLGCIAGLLMSLDGLEFVLSRTGILDIFLMFFVLAAFGCVRHRPGHLPRPGSPNGSRAGRAARAGPRLGIRRWRVAAGDIPRPGGGHEVGRGLVHPRVRARSAPRGISAPAGRPA